MKVKLKLGYLSSLSIMPVRVAIEQKWFEEIGIVVIPHLQMGWKKLASNFLGDALDAAIVPPAMLLAAAENRTNEEVLEQA